MPTDKTLIDVSYIIVHFLINLVEFYVHENWYNQDATEWYNQDATECYRYALVLLRVIRHDALYQTLRVACLYCRGTRTRLTALT
jgi:hypothetical protein